MGAEGLVFSNIESLLRNEIHIWWAFPHRIRDAEILKRHLALLSNEERRRQTRFILGHHRHEYLVSHALVRNVLSRYAPVSPRNWHFELNAFGRPSVAQPTEWQALRFNLSHCDDRIVVAVGWAVEIGVDVETTAPLCNSIDLATDFFSPAEVAQLRRHPERFLDFWTLKEAYVKARGMGLAIPLDTFSFDLSELNNPKIAFHNGCHDHPERWRFLLQRGDGYRMGLAVAHGGEQLRVIQREVDLI